MVRPSRLFARVKVCLSAGEVQVSRKVRDDLQGARMSECARTLMWCVRDARSGRG
jgi:hypothetical protein